MPVQATNYGAYNPAFASGSLGAYAPPMQGVGIGGGLGSIGYTPGYTPNYGAMMPGPGGMAPDPGLAGGFGAPEGGPSAAQQGNAPGSDFGLPGGNAVPGNPNATFSNLNSANWKDYWNAVDPISGAVYRQAPVIAGTTEYSNYANAANEATGWGQYGQQLFSGPAQQSVQQSLGGLDAAARGQLTSQQNAVNAANLSRQGALGNLGFQNLGTQAFEGNLGVAAGQTAGQRYAQGATQNIGQGLGATTAALGQVGQQAGNLDFGTQNYANTLMGMQARGQLTGQSYAAGANQLVGAQAMGQGLGQQANYGALGLLGQAATGQTPSAAQILMNQGIQQAQQQAQSQAASTRGEFGLANAQKNAYGTQAQLATQAAVQGGALRAQEMAGAQQAYAAGTGQAAGLESQAAQNYAQNAQNYAGLQAGAAGALSGSANAQTQAYLQGLGLQGNMIGQGAQYMTQAQIAQAQQAQQLAALQAGGYAQAGQLAGTLAGQQIGAAQNYGQLQNQMVGQQLGALSNYNQAAQGNLGQQLQYVGGQEATALQQAQMAANLGIAQGNLTLGQAGQAMQQNIANQQQYTQLAGAGLSAIGSMAGAAFAASDERVKTDVSQDEEAPNFGAVMEQLDAFRPTRYRYKETRYAPNQEAPDGVYHGILAQDVERGPAGKTLVQHIGGVKHINLGAMVGTLAAGEGALKRRTDSHADRLAALERAVRRAA